MLASLLLKIMPISTVPEIPFLGRALHSLTLELIARQSRELSSALHDQNALKPFRTAGPFLWGTYRAVKNLSAGGYYALVITTLDPEIATALQASCDRASTNLTEIVLDKVFCRIEEAQYSSIGYDTLFCRYFPNGTPSRSLEITFDTPTTFRSSGKNIPLPLPELVFGSLLERWNSYAPVTLSSDLKEFVREKVGIAYCDIKAWGLTVAGGRQVSFVGRCGYQVLRYDPDRARALALLADFAWFAGVGAKTAMGMGQARRTDRGCTLPHRTGEQAEPGG